MNTFFSEVFPNDENIRRTKAKLLNIHGKRDDVINVTNSLNIQKVINKLYRFFKLRKLQQLDNLYTLLI